MKLRPSLVLALAVVPLVIVAMLHPALASNAGAASGTAQTLPWEGPLNNLTASLSGPTAKAISVIAIFIAGLGLIFGEDLGGFAKKMLMIVIAAGFLLFATSLMGNLTSGALI